LVFNYDGTEKTIDMPKQLIIRYWAIYYFIPLLQSVHFWDVYVR